jgi:flagellar biogenesis protein FliO
MGYIGKFVAFLSMLLLGFYGVLQLFKKGIIKKGNLGFLNSTKLVEVLSTTHVAPKRSLMMVRAHKQVFLVASSETGIQYLSEIKDVAGLLKEGEKAIAGSNFDSEFTVAEKIEKEFRMKDEVSSEDLSRYGSLDDLLDETDEPIKLSGKAPAKVATQAYGATKPNMGANKQSAEASKALARSIDSDKDQVRLSDQIKTKLRGLKQLQ